MTNCVIIDDNDIEMEKALLAAKEELLECRALFSRLLPQVLNLIRFLTVQKSGMQSSYSYNPIGTINLDHFFNKAQINPLKRYLGTDADRINRIYLDKGINLKSMLDIDFTDSRDYIRVTVRNTSLMYVLFPELNTDKPKEDYSTIKVNVEIPDSHRSTVFELAGRL